MKKRIFFEFQSKNIIIRFGKEIEYNKDTIHLLEHKGEKESYLIKITKSIISIIPNTIKLIINKFKIY